MAAHEPPALLLVGHGTRDRRGLEEFQETVRLVAHRLPERIVQGCFLELAQPDIGAGIESLVARGVRRLLVQPLLLFAAGHAKRDIPTAVQAAAGRHELDVQLRRPLEFQQELIDLSLLRYREALAGRTEISVASTFDVLVGRGSADPEAIASMLKFGALRASRSPVGRPEACFLAMASPTLDETLRRAAESPCRRVVVQPHLLFAGELTDAVRRSVAEATEARPDKEWILVPHLGPHPLLVQAIVRRVVPPGEISDNAT